jgi:hypothetical protein
VQPAIYRLEIIEIIHNQGIMHSLEKEKGKKKLHNLLLQATLNGQKKTYKHQQQNHMLFGTPLLRHSANQK